MKSYESNVRKGVSTSGENVNSVLLRILFLSSWIILLHSQPSFLLKSKSHIMQSYEKKEGEKRTGGKISNLDII